MRSRFITISFQVPPTRKPWCPAMAPAHCWSHRRRGHCIYHPLRPSTNGGPPPCALLIVRHWRLMFLFREIERGESLFREIELRNLKSLQFAKWCMWKKARQFGCLKNFSAATSPRLLTLSYFLSRVLWKENPRWWTHDGLRVQSLQSPPLFFAPACGLAGTLGRRFFQYWGWLGWGRHDLKRYTRGVIFAACQVLFYCNNALEAEIQAIMLGMNLALQWSSLLILVQSDFKVVLSSLSDTSLLKSEFGNLVKEIKNFLVVREFKPLKLLRDQNRVAHCLATYARMARSTACLL